MWGRWDYWVRVQLEGRLPADPIPQIDFLDGPDSRAMKMLDATLTRHRPTSPTS